MALQKTVEFKGITVVDAYIKIAWAKVYKKDGVLTCWISVEEKANASAMVFDQSEMEFDFDLTGVNPLIQGYAHLKTLPEFTGAIDV